MRRPTAAVSRPELEASGTVRFTLVHLGLNKSPTCTNVCVAGPVVERCGLREPTLTQPPAQSQEISPSGDHWGEATSGDITNGDIEARLEKYLEEEAVRQGMWNSARVAGWVGLILIIMLIVVLVEALQNKPLSISH